MKKLIIPLMLLIGLTVGIAACGIDKCPGEKVCGNGCAPIGASCCPDDEHYCDAPYTCGADNLCHGSGGGGGGNTCSSQGYSYTCINNLCSPGLWCCYNGCSGCGCR